jgi:hypothetical protein
MAKLKKEAFALIPPTIFFFAALYLVALMRRLMWHGTGIPMSSWLSVSVSALVLAKAILLADLLPFIDRFPFRPLIWNIVWKSVIYVIAATGLHYLEQLVEYWRQTGGFEAANRQMLEHLDWQQFWAIHIFLCVMVLMYCVTHELVRALGPAKVWQLFFGERSGPAGKRDS